MSWNLILVVVVRAPALFHEKKYGGSSESVQGYQRDESVRSVRRNFILKPFVHFLTCWDAVDRKKLQKQCDWAVAQRDKFYQDSLSLVSSDESTGKRRRPSLEMVPRVEEKSRATRCVEKLERAACMDLEAYSTDASAFLQKWENSYNATLESVQDDIGPSPTRSNPPSQGTPTWNSSKHNFTNTQNVWQTMHRRAANMRALRDILQSRSIVSVS